MYTCLRIEGIICCFLRWRITRDWIMNKRLIISITLIKWRLPMIMKFRVLFPPNRFKMLLTYFSLLKMYTLKEFMANNFHEILLRMNPFWISFIYLKIFQSLIRVVIFLFYWIFIRECLYSICLSPIWILTYVTHWVSFLWN